MRLHDRAGHVWRESVVDLQEGSTPFMRHVGARSGVARSLCPFVFLVSFGSKRPIARVAKPD